MPLIPSFSPSDGEKVAEGRMRDFHFFAAACAAPDFFVKPLARSLLRT
jgi:hypothetical protein